MSTLTSCQFERPPETPLMVDDMASDLIARGLFAPANAPVFKSLHVISENCFSSGVFGERRVISSEITGLDMVRKVCVETF
ncbi:hypothetical protein RRG08_045119 [Elysia crispata]|uniref:Uncharacterized protein n=1 Tax=Elysia crispata TaxID=231223 RepID=A0AAE0YT85_9GAST|nr:hypothetical protein RRG08_045119 [Elysia crispata]